MSDQEEAIDLALVAATSERLFAARRAHTWPPTVIAHAEWGSIYAEAADGLDVLDSVGGAVEWANEFIARVVASG